MSTSLKTSALRLDDDGREVVAAVVLLIGNAALARHNHEVQATGAAVVIRFDHVVISDDAMIAALSM